MQNIIDKLNSIYLAKQVSEIKLVYEEVLGLNLKDPLYNQKFIDNLIDNISQNKLDYKSVIASIIYVVRRNGIGLKNFKEDEDIESILKALNSIEKLNIISKEEQLESIKKMFIGLAKDMRVILIKLCIEQTKLNFLNKLKYDELELLMKGCNDIYAPLAAMLGMSQIKNAMENATFKYYKPKLYSDLSKALNKYVEERNEIISEVIEKIKKEISPICSHFLVYGRQKQLASIAKKLQRKNMGINEILDIYGRKKNLEDLANQKSFNEITLTHILDILAIRVIVDTVDECYAVLGKIFSSFKPFGNFKDYIANPKENGYQSLHTAIILDNGDPVEVQIRTFDMHNYAEYGLAAHWAYKEKHKVKESDVKINYIRSVMDLYKDKSPDEMLDILKTDVYVGKVFVQSPLGKILEFPEGATTIDFAYAIHSKIGDSCVGAKINGKMVPLTTPLNNGDMVEIITNPNSKGPSRDWLKICKTTGAKNKINNFFKREMKDDNIRKGKSILEAQSKVKNINLSKLLKDKYLEEVFDRYSFASLDDMYASIGYGGINSTQILNKLVKVFEEDTQNNMSIQNISTISDNNLDKGNVLVRGYSNMLTKFAKCCNPMPGDEITGYISRGKGITIHRADCPSLNLCEFDRLIECEWKNAKSGSFIGAVSIICLNTSSTIAQITKKINDLKITISGVSSKVMNDDKLMINLRIFVNSKSQLDEIMQKIKQLSIVYEIYRGF